MSVTSIYLLHKKEFEPIVRPKDYVAILTPQRKWVYGRVIYLEPIQPQIVSLGSLGAASASNYPTYQGMYELEEMELGRNEFGQYRLFVLDDFLVEVYQPAATSRFNLKAGPTKISVKSPQQFLEIYVYEDEVPTIKYYSTLFTSITNARLMFYGYRYVIQKLPVTSEKDLKKYGIKEYTVIPASGVAPSPAT